MEFRELDHVMSYNQDQLLISVKVARAGRDEAALMGFLGGVLITLLLTVLWFVL